MLVQVEEGVDVGRLPVLFPKQKGSIKQVLSEDTFVNGTYILHIPLVNFL